MRLRPCAAPTAVFVAGVGLAAAFAWLPARAVEDAERAAAVTAATQVATHWLAALDGGEYAATWDDLAAVMRAGRQQEDWISEVAGPRAMLGKALIRELQRTRFTTTVRGGPEGKYVIATYLSQFSKAPPTVETLLLVFDGERWRIGGYQVASADDAPPPAPAGKADAGGHPGD